MASGTINEVYMVPNEGEEEWRRRMYAPSKEQMAGALKFVAIRE